VPIIMPRFAEGQIYPEEVWGAKWSHKFPFKPGSWTEGAGLRQPAFLQSSSTS